MHSQLALTELSSPKLAPFILLDPVFCSALLTPLSVKGLSISSRMAYLREQVQPTHLIPGVVWLPLCLLAGRPLEVDDEVTSVGAGGQVAVILLAVEVVEAGARRRGRVLAAAQVRLRKLTAELGPQEPEGRGEG